MGRSRPLFLYFRFFYFIVQMVDKILPMLEFELRIYGVGSDPSTNRATPTAQQKLIDWRALMSEDICSITTKFVINNSISLEKVGCCQDKLLKFDSEMSSAGKKEILINLVLILRSIEKQSWSRYWLLGRCCCYDVEPRVGFLFWGQLKVVF